MSCPASLFLVCWQEAHQAAPSTRLDAENIEFPVSVKQTIAQALANSDGEVARQTLEQLLETSRQLTQKARLALLLLIMREIDHTFAPIHPRAFASSGSGQLANWLLMANEARRCTGVYAAHESLRLIPRGPLTRAQRGELSSYADTLEDRFAHITAVPAQLQLSGTRVDLSFSPIVDEDPLLGVHAGDDQPGRERVCVVPVAEKLGDLSLQPRQRGQRRYLEIGPSPDFQPAQVLLSALKRVPNVDIGLAPEFVMSSKAHEEVVASLHSSPTACRLLLAGTANTIDHDDGLPWNEAVVTNHFGVALWRQRKLWPSMLDEARAKTYNIMDMPGVGAYHEHNASGSCIQVVDIDSIGRCVILICQDVVNAMAEDLLRCLQPDWVFVPILDRGFAVRSWFVDRARSLSTVSKARLLISMQS